MATVDALDRGGEWGTPFSWTNAFVKTYVLTRAGANTDDIEGRFAGFIEERVSNDRYRRDDVFLQPLNSIHLHSRLRFDPPGTGGIRSVRLLLGLSIFILGIAVANFVNLAVARSLQRSREVAMRKVVGAARPQLIIQLLGESLIVAGLATLFALPLVYAARPWFESLIGRPLPAEALLGAWAIPFLAAVALVTGLISGLYPALMMSRLRPSQGLRSRHLSVGRGRSRRALIVVQFAIAMGLVATTVLVVMQMRYISSTDLGYQASNLVVVRIGQSEAVARNADAVAARLQQQASIQLAGTSHSVPSAFLNEFSYRLAGADIEDRVSLGSVSVGTRFFETFGMTLHAGRFLDADRASDSTSFVINVSAARQLGFDPPSGALGERIEWLMPGLGFTGTVVGITEDLHFGSLRDRVPAIVFHLSRFGVSYLAFRPTEGMLQPALQAADAEWVTLEPSHPFEPELLTDRIAFQYVAERRLSVMVGVASGLAILLACLGLFGLTAFMAERRRKEIGIRKVLGASTGSLVGLFFREFLPWILVAFALIAPVAWIGASRWLETFAFHVSPGPIPYLIGFLVTSVAALAAIGLKTITASQANPVSSLQVE